MTINYYNRNAEAFRQRTADRDMQSLYDAFLSPLPAHAHIFDAGCGPGRDSLAFLKRGYEVTAADASAAMVEMATAATKLPVLLLPFGQIEFENEFDGIWANASLLHVPSAQIDDVLARLTRALKSGGAIYMSFKVGDGQRMTGDGRLFCDYTETSLRSLLLRHPMLDILNIHETDPVTEQVDGKSWLHATCRKYARRAT